MHSERLLRDYFRAKDENRPHILEEVFADDARLEVVSRSDQFGFPAFTVGREAIADVLVRRFNQVYENIYSFYLRRPKADDPTFSCNWLVAMTEKASRSVRVGCGRYDWTFRADGTRVDSLVITIAEMLNLESAAAVPIWQCVASLHYPWTNYEEVGRLLPLDQIRPVVEYLRLHERPN